MWILWSDFQPAVVRTELGLRGSISIWGCPVAWRLASIAGLCWSKLVQDSVPQIFRCGVIRFEPTIFSICHPKVRFERCRCQNKLRSHVLLTWWSSTPASTFQPWSSPWSFQPKLCRKARCRWKPDGSNDPKNLRQRLHAKRCSKDMAAWSPCNNPWNVGRKSVNLRKTCVLCSFTCDVSQRVACNYTYLLNCTVILFLSYSFQTHRFTHPEIDACADLSSSLCIQHASIKLNACFCLPIHLPSTISLPPSLSLSLPPWPSRRVRLPSIILKLVIWGSTLRQSNMAMEHPQ